MPSSRARIVDRTRAIDTKSADRSALDGCAIARGWSGIPSGSGRARPSGEGGVPGEGLPEDEGVNVVRPLVGVDRLDVAQVSARLELVGNSVGTQNLPRQTCALARNPDVVPLAEGNLRGCHLPFVLQAAEAKGEELRLGDLGGHPDQLFLLELEGGDRFSEDDALPCVRQGLLEDRLRQPDTTPGDTVARLIEALERGLEAVRAGQEVSGRDGAVLEDEFGGDRGTQRKLASVIPRREAGRAALYEEAADRSVVTFRPDLGDIGNRSVGDPGLGAVQHIAVAPAQRARAHAGRIAARVRLGQTEAADGLALRHGGKPAILLLFGAEREDRIHAQGPLHGDEGTEGTG